MKKVIEDNLEFSTLELQKLEAMLFLAYWKNVHYYGKANSITQYALRSWGRVYSIMENNGIKQDMKLSDHEEAFKYSNIEFNK
jgi:hypothetical protein